MNFKDKVKFPFLIHRFEKQIETEISNLRQEREEIAVRLKRLTAALSEWHNDAWSAIDSIKFAIHDDNREMELLASFGSRNEIPPSIKMEKYKEIFDIPDYSPILNDVAFLSGMGEENLMRYVEQKTGNVKVVETTVEEKNGIVEKHSVYIHNQRDYDAYVAISFLCESVNIINFKWNASKNNRIERSDLARILPNELQKFIAREHPDEGTLRRRMVLNFEWYKDKG